MRIEVGCNTAVCNLVSLETGSSMHDAFRTIAVWNTRNKLVGGVCFNSYTGAGIEMSGAGRWIVLASVRQNIGDLVFGYLGCRRLAITVRVSNKRMRRLAPRLGFVYEGKARYYYTDEDGLQFSLLSREAIDLGHWKPRISDAAQAA